MKTFIQLLLILVLPFMLSMNVRAQSSEQSGTNAITQLEASAGGSYMVSAPGASDGRLVVYAAGGQGAYTYSLNGGKAQTSNVFKGLPAGTYSVRVMDAGQQSVVTNPLTIFEPAEENAANDLYYDIFDVNRPGWPAAENEVVAAPELVFYNVFSPNGDGVNDAWVIGNIENYPQNRLMVFNASGQLVFSQNHYQNNWTAHNLRQGVYFYVLSVDQNNSNNIFKGSVALLK